MIILENNDHKDHRKRMRKRFRDSGFESFHDHEVLEFLLYYAYARCDTNKFAHRFLNKFGNLANLFDTDVTKLMETLGCTETVAVLLKMIPELSQRYLLSKWDKKTIFNN